jgi:hypothetical protein
LLERHLSIMENSVFRLAYQNSNIVFERYRGILKNSIWLRKSAEQPQEARATSKSNRLPFYGSAVQFIAPNRSTIKGNMLGRRSS